MTKGFTYEQVSEYFKLNDCKLLSKEYKNTKTKLEFLCSCGHKRISPLNAVKKYNQFNCIKCTRNPHFKKTINSIHPKTFDATKIKMNKEISRIQKYKEDFQENNYTQKFKCSNCNRKKPRYLFPNNSKYKCGKEKRCKLCGNLEHQKRRKKHDINQHMKTIMSVIKTSARKRGDRGRSECSIIEIKNSDIIELYKKQNGMCIYTGQKIIWEYNHPYKVSVDRINSDKGYTKDNIQLVAFIVNQAKNNLTEEIFLDMIKSIYTNKILKF